MPCMVTCVFVIQQGKLREVMSPNLPHPLLKNAYGRAGGQPPSAGNDVREKEGQSHFLAGFWPREVLSSTGHLIGSVDVYSPHSATPTDGQEAVLRGAVRLAGIVIQHRELYEQLAFQAERDPLTELPNRPVFQR